MDGMVIVIGHYRISAGISIRRFRGRLFCVFGMKADHITHNNEYVPTLRNFCKGSTVC